MKYFSTQRPVMPGAYPKAVTKEIVNFDSKSFCKEIERTAWGYITTARELTAEEISEYELVADPMNIGCRQEEENGV